MRLSRSIIFTVPLLSSFVASVGNPVTEDVGRTFYMDGPSALACAAVGFLCFHVPSRFPQEAGRCEDRMLFFSVRYVRHIVSCDELIEDVCKRENQLRFTPRSLIRSNLGGQGPDHGPTQDILIGNVFPGTTEKVDAVITVAATKYVSGSFCAGSTGRCG